MYGGGLKQMDMTLQSVYRSLHVDDVWSGDEDMCVGKLQCLYTEYTDRRQFVTHFGLDGRQDVGHLH